MKNSSLDRLLRWLRFRKIIKHIQENSVICDIGCGQEAYFLRGVCSLVKYGIGLDRDVEDYYESKFELKQVNILEDIPLESKKFDVVTMIAILEHLEKPQEVLKETFRILKKGGKLVLTTPTPLAKPILKVLAYSRLIDENEIQGHKNYFWPKEIKEMLLRAGFNDVKTSFFDVFLNSLITAQK